MDFFSHAFTVRALIVAIALGIVLPALGVLLVMRKMSLIADALSHVALSAVAVGLAINFYPVWVGVGGAAVTSLAMEEIRSRSKLPAESLLALTLYGSLAVTIIIFSTDLIPVGRALLLDYLFGNLFGITPGTLILVVVLMAAVLLVLIPIHRQASLMAFDLGLAHTAGIKIKLISRILALITGISVAVGMLAVGVLMVGTLLVTPALSALRVARGTTNTIIVASGFGLLFSVGGVFLSYFTDLPASACIALFGIATLMLLELLRLARSRLKR